MSKVAWIGLGVMGYPMAGHLKMRGHHDVVVFNRTRKRAEAWSPNSAALPRAHLRRPRAMPTSSSPVSATMMIFVK